MADVRIMRQVGVRRKYQTRKADAEVIKLDTVMKQGSVVMTRAIA